MDYESTWKQLYAEVLARMDKYALTNRCWYQVFRALAERMEQLEKGDDT